MKQNSTPSQTHKGEVEHNKAEHFVGVATTTNATLPRYARLPINRCNLPADILGGLTFQRAPVALELDGVAQFHCGLFELLDKLDDAHERARAFSIHMNAAFYLDQPEQAGYTDSTLHKRQKADYLRMMRGWSFDSDGVEGAALKGWVESRFGLLPRQHGGHIRDFSGEAYRSYLEMRATALYGTNAIESQFDLLYTYSQYELARLHPDETHLTLYRGVNRLDEYETIATLDNKHRIVLFNNLNSFTANLERADEFGDYLLTAQVPISKVFCYSRLLPGMLQGEDEYTVIGGLYEVGMAAY
ncbi:MAG: NAD(+)--dinitrogen-reductase ADP-D-ribosyltransferase [Gammaproteobacteria bacterium]|nr:NAD(+)--dinitrogen-reductase ADP-D-ribosyltransferase [Gammaproteobacteria bacterium]MBU1624928.1 NAD(+)--dinitrogen-reductase ADP-D-ribosyltransferase [Gammaproteobacteria bacterium]MBU1982227.1 NAD(+)--dinitrogen-reductase ADP-D-ribosyltransferase [Gammaproteobacteria bacterium]